MHAKPRLVTLALALTLALPLPLTGRVIPIIGDHHADPEKGTGFVKITPAHDPNDFEVGRRHDLPQVICMDEKGVMNAEAGPVAASRARRNIRPSRAWARTAKGPATGRR